jgi:hypothetical protein
VDGEPVSEQSERSETPDGSAGVEEQEVIFPPVLVGDATKPPKLRGKETVSAKLKAGARSMMASVKVAEVLRALDDAVRVTVPELKTAVGVPETVQDPLAAVTASPLGSEGEMEQETIAPPEFVATSELTAVPTVPDRLEALRLSTGAEFPTLRRRRTYAVP